MKAGASAPFTRMRRRVPALAALCLLFLAAPAFAQERPGPRIVLPDPALDLPAFRLSPLDAVFVTQPFATWVQEWAAATRALLATNERRMLLRNRVAVAAPVGVESIEVAVSDTVAAAPPADTVDFLPPLPPPRRARADANPLGGVIGEYADLGVRISGNGNLGGAWTRYNPCDPGLQFTCTPGAFPELKPDLEVAVRAAGTLSDRVHVDVDYDQTREFDAANNINVYYQGLTNEVLQRIEVGDVSIRLPSSRYLTRGVPAGNFGLMAAAQVGPLDVQTVIAQQKGDVTTKEFRLGTGGQAGVEQDAELVIDDAEYVRGQFFFLVPPTDIAAYPHIDVLGLRGLDAPASVRPAAGGQIQVYRDERLTGSAGAQPGFFLAEATPPTGTQRHTGSFRRLIQEQDYIIHASGLWLMLRSPLRPDEALAISFVTETGDTVGVMDAESAPPGTTPRLRLLRSPSATHQPGAGTWDMEMHQVYRLDSSTEVDLTRIELTISLGGLAGGITFRDVLGQQLTFLKFFGLDEDSPADRIDEAQVFQPARDGFGGTTSGSATAAIGGTYIVFPTLRPFAAPAPVQSARVTAADLLAALGRDANDAIYDDIDPVTRAASARFQLNFRYRVKVDGIVSSFSLGAFGLREGSERMYLGSRLLERNVDYNIDYEIGTVTLLNPGALFATSPGADLRATWEQKPLFSIAPTTVFGTSARYDIGARGELNFVGLYQAEKSLMSRPQLGNEPGAAFLGGVGGRFDLGGALLDRMVGAIPGMRSSRPSSLAVTGELAFSLPNPNRDGFAFLDDFETSDEVSLGLRRADWKLGSAPQAADGDRGTLPFTLDAASALPIVWQHDFLQGGAVRGALLPATHIDRNINIVGEDRPETVMWLTFGDITNRPSPLPPPPDAKRWRSMTAVLSPTGRDMSRSEYVEFYVSAGSAEPLALIFDIGTVSEDAFYVDSLGNTTGTYEDGRPWGLGRLDEEARIINREVWGTDRDQLGLWDQNCRAEPILTYPLGDARANCTRNNGVQDSEDLNGNGILDADDGQYFRYVVQLDQLSEFLVRDTAATGTGYRLYRIPLRDGVPVNGANDATWRFIRHMRMTIAGEPSSVRVLSIARMRIVGSRWTKRDVHGVQRGLLDAEPGAGSLTTEVRVGPVSVLTDGAVYRGPPGVGDRAQDPTQQFGRTGYEINEKSLRLAYTDLQGGDRAEVYYRYPQQPRNMLLYRELRLFVLPREGDWGPDGNERFTVRVGTDPNNFYLYQTRLHPATGDRPATGSDWLPELIIDFQQWFDLKAQAERLLIERGPRTAGVDTLWSADSTYGLVLEDRARAPNLAAVRELVFAVYNGAGGPTNGEVWINEMRVGIPDTEPGGAGTIVVDMVAGDLVSASVSLSNQGALFRQLNETPGYVAASNLNVTADARLDRLMPASWGIDLPVSVSHTRAGQDPTFLQQSDVQADQLSGLREAGSDATRIGMRLSKRTPTANPWLSLLIDGAAVRLGWQTSTNRALTTRMESNGLTGDVSYRRDLAPRSFGALPGFLEEVLRAVSPASFENSEVFTRIVNSRLRWSPATISFGSTYDDQLTRSFRYDRILALPGDTSVLPVESPRQGLRSDAQLTLRPFDQMSFGIGISSERDLLAPERATTRNEEIQALERARTRLGGMDVGWERTRALNTTLSYRPNLTRWLRAEYTYANRYATDRNPSYLELQIEGADTTAQMQRRFEAGRQVTRRLFFQPPGMLSAAGLDTTGIVYRALRRFEFADLTWRSTLSSQFERETFTPGFGYQFGIGDLRAFNVIGSDTAARAQDRGEFRATAALGLVGALRLDLGYHSADTRALDARGGTRLVTEVGWPKATLNFRPTQPAGLFSFLTSFAASAGVERIERRTEDGLLATQRRGGTELRVPVTLTLGLPGGFTTMYRASMSFGETIDPTGNAESGGLQQDLTVTAIVMLPEALRNRLSRPISLSVQLMQQDQRQCRFTSFITETDGCIAFLDNGTRTANVFIESAIRDLTVGLQSTYVGRANHIGTLNTTSQFQLGFYGRFNLSAGQLPGQMPR
jgi:hypothetical protein